MFHSWHEKPAIATDAVRFCFENADQMRHNTRAQIYPGERSEIFREFLEWKIIVDDHLAESRERRFAVSVLEFKCGVEETKNSLAILHSRQKDHQTNVIYNQIQVRRCQVVV